MIDRRLLIAVFCASAAGEVRIPMRLFRRNPPTGPSARISPKEATFVFPAASSLLPCSYRRHSDPQLRLYSWTVNIGGPGQDAWYAIDLWPAVPDTAASDAAWSLAAILKNVRPYVARVGGEPPLTLDVVDSTHVHAAAIGGQVVIRLTSKITIARLFAQHP